MTAFWKRAAPKGDTSGEPWLNGGNSPSRRWRIEWEDGFDTGKGRARVNLDGRVVRTIPEAERPQDGTINDEGVALLVDWLASRPDRPKYQSAVLVSTPKGGIVVHSFSANADKLTVHRPFDFALVTFCGTPSDEAPSLAAFRLSDGVKLWVIADMPTEHVRIDEQRGVILCGAVNDPEYFAIVAFDGIVLHRPARWRPPNGYELLNDALEAIADPVREEEAEALFEKARSLKVSAYQTAHAHKTFGAVYDERGNRAQTVWHYRAALAIDPSVGVKKRLAALERP